VPCGTALAQATVGGSIVRYLPLVAFSSLLAACAPPSVDGPFTGRPHAYTLDGLTMPRSRADYADDLNGDGRPDNQLGAIAQVLYGQGFGPTGTPAGVTVTLLANDDALANDDSVGLEWRPAPGAEPVTLGGRLAGGRFVSNRARTTTAPALGVVRLPLVDGVGPLALDVVGLEAELDPDGAGGFDGQLHAAIDPELAVEASYAALERLIAERPALALVIVAAFDANGDGRVSYDEWSGALAVKELVGPDVQLFDDAGRWAPNPNNDRKDSLSLGVRFHLAPEGR
jgi:hypothetical protein